MKVLISGGGIGGLTTALCCLHHGHDVTLFEQAQTIGEVGAGLQIPPNAMRIFERLGVADRIAATAFAPEAIETRMGESGTTLFTIPLAAMAVSRWGAPYLHSHRADYIAALLDAVTAQGTGIVQLGSTVSDFRQDDDGVTALLADGRDVQGDVLIGADGIHSALRDQLLGPDQPQFTGNVAWRAVVPIDRLGGDAPAPTACAWMGRGRHAVTYRLRQGRLANFVGVVERTDWQVESWTEQADKQEALLDFAGWHPTITRILQETDGLFRWALFDRPPLSHWTEGRVALLGDAAHPMLPFLAQGAAMAVEDAWALAAELSRPGQTVSDALKAYEARRLPRTAKVQARSRNNAKTFHKRSAMARLATYGPMWLGGRLAPSIVHQRMDWLYGYDEIAIP